MKTSRPTLQDIADRLGITTMTVSRYFRNPSSVAQTTQDKIAAVVEELGYIQNRVPAIMSQSSSKIIGVVLSSLSNQVFASLVQGIESVTKKHGYEVIIAHTDYDELEEEKKIAMLLSYRVDAMVLTETNHSARTIKMIEQAGIPVVEAMELPDRPVDMAVGLDHQITAYEVVNKVIEKGRKSVVFLGACYDTRTSLRLKGYCRAVTEAGLDVKHISTKEHTSFSKGGELLAQALSEYPDVDAVFCTNDDIAIGAMMYCAQKQISVPKEISVVGYNALDIGQAVLPKLTSVETPRYAIGKKSAELLLSSLNGEHIEQKVYDLGYRLTDGATL